MPNKVLYLKNNMRIIVLFFLLLWDASTTMCGRSGCGIHDSHTDTQRRSGESVTSQYHARDTHVCTVVVMSQDHVHTLIHHAQRDVRYQCTRINVVDSWHHTQQDDGRWISDVCACVRSVPAPPACGRGSFWGMWGGRWTMPDPQRTEAASPANKQRANIPSAHTKLHVHFNMEQKR